jgi:cellulose synthase (UDP-forming)
MASYVSQQRRWARGCLSALPHILRASLPLRLRAQYLLSGMYFLTGWTVLIYMSLPVVRILTGAQPLAGATADQFLVHFAPASAGTYTFAAFSLAVASFWVQIGASISVLTGRRGRFVVTPKRGSTSRQPRAVLPALCVMVVLVGVALWGLARSQSPATLNNVSFALLHVSVLAAGVGPALRKQRRAAVDTRAAMVRREAA